MLTLEDRLNFKKTMETLSHNQLVAAGGRPAYPLDLLDRVSEDPSVCREALLPWQDYPERGDLHWDHVFQRQLRRWEHFHAWQRDNRHPLDDKTEFLLFAPAHEETYRALGDPENQIVKYVRSAWLSERGPRRADRHALREDRTYAGFDDYLDHVRRRLEKHGFTRPFELLPDPTQQSQVATWVEYLGYEYAWLDRHSRDIEKHQQTADEAWDSLKSANVLMPHETADFLTTVDSQIQRRAAVDNAERAAGFAELAIKVATAEVDRASRGHSRLTAEEASARLREAQASLAKAKAAVEEGTRRIMLIAGFLVKEHPLREAKRDHFRQQLLIKWVLGHVHQILEGPSPPPQHSPKRQLSEDDEAVESSSARKKRRSAPPPSVPPPATTTPLEEEPARKVERNPRNRRKAAPNDAKPSNNQTNDVSPLPQAPRRSARLAAKQPAAPPPPGTAESSPPASRGKTAKPRRPAPKPKTARPARSPAQSKGKKVARGGAATGESGRPKRTRAKGKT